MNINFDNTNIKYLHNSVNFNTGPSANSLCKINQITISRETGILNCYDSISSGCGQAIANDVFVNGSMKHHYIQYIKSVNGNIISTPQGINNYCNNLNIGDIIFFTCNSCSVPIPSPTPTPRPSPTPPPRPSPTPPPRPSPIPPTPPPRPSPIPPRPSPRPSPTPPPRPSPTPPTPIVPLTCIKYVPTPKPSITYCADPCINSKNCNICSKPCTVADDCSGINYSGSGISRGAECQAKAVQGCPTCPPPPSPPDICIDNIKQGVYNDYSSCIYAMCSPYINMNKYKKNTYLNKCSTTDSSNYVQRILGKVFDNCANDCLDLSYMCAEGMNYGKSTPPNKKPTLYVIIRIDDMGLQEYGDYYKTEQILNWSKNYNVPINIGIMGQNFINGASGGSNGFIKGHSFRIPKANPVWQMYLDNSNLISQKVSSSNIKINQKNPIWEFFSHGYIHSQEQTCPEFLGPSGLPGGEFNPIQWSSIENKTRTDLSKGVCADYGKNTMPLCPTPSPSPNMLKEPPSEISISNGKCYYTARYDGSCQCSWQFSKYKQYRNMDITLQYENIIQDIFEASLNAKINTFIPPLNLMDKNSLQGLSMIPQFNIISLADTNKLPPCVNYISPSPSTATASPCTINDKYQIQQDNISYKLLPLHANSANSYFEAVAIGQPVNTILKNTSLKEDCYTVNLDDHDHEYMEHLESLGQAHLHNNIKLKSMKIEDDDNTDNICPLKVQSLKTTGGTEIYYSVMMFHAFSTFLRPSNKQNKNCVPSPSPLPKECFFDYYTWLEAFYHSATSHDYYDISFVTFSQLHDKITQAYSSLQKDYVGDNNHTAIYIDNDVYVAIQHIYPECFTKSYCLFKDKNLKTVRLGKISMDKFINYNSENRLIYNFNL